MWKTLPFLLLAACAADSIDQTDPASGDDDTSSVESDVIGSENMVEYNFNLAGNTLDRVNGDSWSNDWSHVVPLDVGTTHLLFLYSRGMGTAKVIKVNTDGSWSTLSTPGVAANWDSVVGTKVVGAGANLVFYRKSDNVLKTAQVTATGGFSVVATQAPFAAPAGGWDIIATAPSAFGILGELVGYKKSTGAADLFKLNIISHEYDFVNNFTWQTTWDQIDGGDVNGDGIADFVFYSKSTGDLKTVLMQSDNSMGTSSTVSASVSSGARVVLGNFTSGTTMSTVLYQTDGGPGTNGRLRLWNFGVSLPVLNDSNVQSGWTHLVPMSLGAANKGLLFYSNHGPV